VRGRRTAAGRAGPADGPPQSAAGCPPPVRPDSGYLYKTQKSNIFTSNAFGIFSTSRPNMTQYGRHFLLLFFLSSPLQITWSILCRLRDILQPLLSSPALTADPPLVALLPVPVAAPLPPAPAAGEVTPGREGAGHCRPRPAAFCGQCRTYSQCTLYRQQCSAVHCTALHC
jgi:hypothetical protein